MSQRCEMFSAVYTLKKYPALKSATLYLYIGGAIILALSIISFVQVFLFPLYNNQGRGIIVRVRTYLDLETSLCLDPIKKRKIRKSSRCPHGIVTGKQGGRLGNQMWQYASVWAFARRTGLKPYIPRCIKVRLDQIFKQLTVPTLEEISHCPVYFKQSLDSWNKSLDSWNLTSQNIILPKYAMLPETVLTWVQDIVQEFTIKKELVEKSQQILRLAIQKSLIENHTFVGVHIRRTDYINQLERRFKSKPADINFYKAAMRIFEEKYQNVVFVIVSDEPSWCYTKFAYKPNAYVTGRKNKNSPNLDLAILASCNHTIFDYGTYGQWGAILAGGETIYYNLTQHASAKLGKLLKNWYTI